MNWTDYAGTEHWPEGAIVVMMTCYMSESESYVCFPWKRDESRWAPKQGGPIRKFLLLELPQ